MNYTCKKEYFVVFLSSFFSGVFLQMFHGSVIDHPTKYSSNVYFVCNPKVDVPKPVMEHVKVGTNQAHFKVETKYAC